MDRKAKLFSLSSFNLIERKIWLALILKQYGQEFGGP